MSMSFPSIGQYTETIKLSAKAPEDYFKKLSNLQPVLDSNGEPIMSSGNFAVIFKMRDIKTGNLYALKCFHREQKQRNEYYQLISQELNKKLELFLVGTQTISTTYLIHFKYYDKEIFVDMDGDTSLFPVLLMEWVDGMTLDNYIRQNLKNKQKLQSITYQFSRMAKWLLSQKFAHGDLKPDNILVRSDGSLVLVDYDGMYVPAMRGRKSIELGSPNFRHPLRTENDFNEHIDDFSIAIILLSLKAISLDPSLYCTFATGDKLLFEEKDYQRINENTVIPLLNKYLYDNELANLLGVFLVLLNCRYFPQNISSLIDLHGQNSNVNIMYSEYEVKEKILLFYKSIDIQFHKIIYLIPNLFHGGMREYWLPPQMWPMCKVEAIRWDDKYRFGNYDAISYSVVGEFSKKTYLDLFKLPDGIVHSDYSYIINFTYDILFEMGVSHYFADNVEILIQVVNKN